MKILSNPLEKVFTVDTSDEKRFDGVRISFMHDYVSFTSYELLTTKDGTVPLLENGGDKVCENCIKTEQRVLIPISVFSEIVLPLLQNNKYMKKENTDRHKYESEEVHFYDEGELKHVVKPSHWNRYVSMTDGQYTSYKSHVKNLKERNFKDFLNKRRCNIITANGMSDEEFYSTMASKMAEGGCF